MKIDEAIYNEIKSHYESLGYKMDNKEEWLDFIRNEVKLFCGDNYLSVIQETIDDAVKKGILEKPEYQPPFEKVHGFEGMVIDYDTVERIAKKV